MTETVKILPPYDKTRTIVIGMLAVGYIDEDDQVIVFDQGKPKLLGAVDHVSEAVKLVDEWRKRDR